MVLPVETDWVFHVIAGRARDRQLKAVISAILCFSRRHKPLLEFRGEGRDFFDSELNSSREREEGRGYMLCIHFLFTFILPSAIFWE